MKRLLILLLLASCAHRPLKPVKVKLVKEVKGLAHCESVVFDPDSHSFFVSVQSAKTKGDGYISNVSTKGEIIKLKFTKGLDNPKGLAIHDGKLYVSDVTVLVKIDLKSGEVLDKIYAEKSKFLNDVTIDRKGNVFVSDMFNSSIYRLDSKTGELNLWHDSVELENPNGLLIDGNTMYVGAWGSFSNGKPMSAPFGRFLKINLRSKSIKKITENGLGNLDGVQFYNKHSFLVTDWVAGKVFLVSKSGESLEVLDTEQSVGDHYYSPETKLMVLPMNKQNKLMFYRFE